MNVESEVYDCFVYGREKPEEREWLLHVCWPRQTVTWLHT